MLAVGRSGDKIPSNRSARADTLGECVSGAQEAALRAPGQEWGERKRNGRQQAGTGCTEMSLCLCGDFGFCSVQTSGHRRAWRILSRSRGLLTPRAGLGTKEHPAQFFHAPAFACMLLMMGRSPLCCLWGLSSHE